MLCWNLFPNTPNSYLYVTFIPLMVTLRVLLAGLQIINDKQTINAMSRTGNPRELLYGPLAYGIIFVLSSYFYWAYSPTGIVALVLLCVGDGVAELMGKKYGKTPLPHNPKKTWVGSISFFVSSILVAIVYLAIFLHYGWFTLSLPHYLPVLVVITLAAMFVESVTRSEWDNVTVFLTCIVVSHLFGY